MNKIKNTIVEFEMILDETPAKLLEYSEDETGKKAEPGKWSKKEILGHLIDSATNNHQRFVRMQLENNLRLPAYEQDQWVSVQHYNTLSWNELVRFWEAYNLHLLHVLRHVSPDKLSNTAIIGNLDEMTLEFIIEDYVGHLKHHLEEIIED
jgi:DinB superfamily